MIRKGSSLCMLLALSLVLVSAVSGVADAQSASTMSTSSRIPGTAKGMISSQIALPAPGIKAQAAPDATVPRSQANDYEYGSTVLSLPDVLRHQWTPLRQIPPESFISPKYISTMNSHARGLSLKEAIYIALRNNPNVRAVALNPVYATEGVRAQNAIFDYDFVSTLDTIKTVTPITTPIETRSGTGLATKNYDWNFGVNKILATTNGTLSLTFNNDRVITNNLTVTINPNITPTMGLSLSQPLLRNFGWKFATINVQIAESAQKQAQWNYAQTLQDFIQQVASNYWNVVGGEESLAVAESAFKFNQDLVRVNAIAVKVGTLAPLDLQEAQSAAATAEANVYTAQAALKNARSTLRQNVMLNPDQLFLPDMVEPTDKPNPKEQIKDDEQDALELAVEYRPSLASMRETIRNALLTVRFQENQLLPQVNLQTQFSVNNLGGNTLCGPTFGVVKPTPGCPTVNGQGTFRLPFNGTYNDTLNKMFNFRYYNYAAIITMERPLANAPARAALAQSRVGYEQVRMQYRALLSQAVVDVQSSIANLRADFRRVTATKSAADYAAEALKAEQERFRVGMATTHDLLQFQNELVTSQGNYVQSQIDLENAKLALMHAEGVLSRDFQINFTLQDPHETFWYSRF